MDMEDILREKLQTELSHIKMSYQKLKIGKLSLQEYRVIAGKYGIYPQPDFMQTDLHLVRFRVAAGRLDKKKLRYLLISIANYNIKQIKLIHTQSIQIHNMQLDKIFEFIMEAWDYGFISLGSASNFPRNVICSPRSGVEIGEYINVFPYAEKANTYLLSIMDEIVIPDKFEIAFSNSPKNLSHATFCDLGFAARKNKCFDVYLAGGVGMQSTLGVLYEENASPKKILYYIKAMLNLYAKYGEYKDFTKSRSSYLQKKLGIKQLCKEFQDCYAKVKLSENLDVHIVPRSVTKVGKVVIEENERISKQKQKGLYTVSYKPICGYMDAEAFKKIYKNIEPLNQVEIRLTPFGSLDIINLNGTEAMKVYLATNGGASNDMESSLTCAGNQYCTRGVADTDNLLLDCLEKLSMEDLATGVLPQLRISGCEVSCSSHQVAELGFQGVQTKEGENAFLVYHSGQEIQGKELFSEPSNIMRVSAVPIFLKEVAEQVRASGMDFGEWILQNPQKMEECITKYAIKECKIE